MTTTTYADPREQLSGLPPILAPLCENIAKALPQDDADKFRADLSDAIGTGDRDLSRVVWAFLAAELRSMPKQKDNLHLRINAVIKGMDLMASGKDWPCADAAADAVYDVVDTAADAVADAVADVVADRAADAVADAAADAVADAVADRAADAAANAAGYAALYAAGYDAGYAADVVAEAAADAIRFTYVAILAADAARTARAAAAAYAADVATYVSGSMYTAFLAADAAAHAADAAVRAGSVDHAAVRQRQAETMIERIKEAPRRGR